MPMNAGILTIFRKYKLELSKEMPLKLNFQAAGLVTHSTDNIYIKFMDRNS